MDSEKQRPHILEILVVDDSRVTLGQVSKYLKDTWLVYSEKEGGVFMEIKDQKSQIALSEPVEITTATSAVEGREALRRKHIDLVLLDVEMPGINGIELLGIIRQDKTLAHVPVIIMSANMNPDLEAEAFRAGATDFIHKPFEQDVIRVRIAFQLHMARLQADLNLEVSRQTQRAEVQAKRAEEQAALARRQAERAEEQAIRNERLLQETVVALSEAIDAKDPYTRGHSVRVANYARTLAALAGDSKAEQESVKTMALLHDIGKIGIPESIITKPARLTEEEYEIIKSHTTIGARILGKITEAPDLVLSAHYHHERYDGKGYPEGLSGEEIPRIARIVGVADAYDTMTSRRSYRDCLPQQVVREQMIKGMGTQFDPQFASLMVKMMDMDKNYRMRADLDSEPVFDPLTAAPGPEKKVPKPQKEADDAPNDVHAGQSDEAWQADEAASGAASDADTDDGYGESWDEAEDSEDADDAYDAETDDEDYVWEAGASGDDESRG